MTDSITSDKAYLIVNPEQRFEIFFNSLIFFTVLNCIALLILLTISCFVMCVWFTMFVCCRDSTGIVEDVQDSMNEVELEGNIEGNISTCTFHGQCKSIKTIAMTSTINSIKQRKLTDLRVADLQRELRSFNILYDKKELKGSLLEKLRQALLTQNLDPDTHLFDTPADLKSISSDENNQNDEENGSHDPNNLETSTMEIDSEQPLRIDTSEQTNSTSPLQTSTTPPSAINEINDDQTNVMDTIGSRTSIENDNIFSTIDQSVTRDEDAYSNDNIDHGLKQVFHSSSDEELDAKNQIQPSTDNNHNNKSNPTTTKKPIPSIVDRKHGEDEQNNMSIPPPPPTTTDLPTDDNNLSKSEIDRQESSEEQQKKGPTNKDQCHLWVSNIAKETHASDLKELFSKYGKVLTTKVIGSSSSQWFGYINLATPDDVEKCINALHQTELHGKKIYVDREMHDPTSHSSTSKSKSNSGSTSSDRHTPSNAQRKQSDHSIHKSSSNNSHQKRDSITDIQDKSSPVDKTISSKKRSASISSENKKKFSTSDVKKPDSDEKSTIKSHEPDTSSRKSTESNNEKRRISPNSSNNQLSKHQSYRTDASKSSEKSGLYHKPNTYNQKNDKYPNQPERSSIRSTDVSKSKISPSASNRSHSNEKHSFPSSSKSDHHRSLSTDKSKQRTSSHVMLNKYEKPKEGFPIDAHRPTTSNTFNNDRRTVYQNEQRLRHEKDMLVHKQYVQQQEEEKIKEQQRRLAEERERMRREFEFLERERLEIERTRMVLEKEKQDQARELGKQQRRLADEAKHRQQQQETKLRDEKLHRLPPNDNKRPRSIQQDSQRSHYTSGNNNSGVNSNNNNNNNNSNKGYDHRPSTNTASGRGRDRSLGDTSREYYPESKRQYTNNTNNQREAIFRDRVVYREPDLPPSTSGISMNPSSSMTSGNNNQRYLPGSSNQHRPADSYNTLPQRGRDMALPPTSSISTAYERPSRNTGVSPTNTNAILRRPHSRERFDDREYMQQVQRRDRSPPPTSTLRREPVDTSHWERPKPRDSTLYVDDTRKYLPNQYLSEPSQAAQQQQQQQQQQGLWSAAPPSRQQHHHPDLAVKTAPHASVVDPYNWQHVSQQVPPSSHHSQGLSSSHDRPHPSVISNQRIPILPSNQPPPPPPLPSSRGGTTGQTHLYSHPGVPISALSTSQQHTSLLPPPTSLHHTTSYVTQQGPPSGLVLRPTGQTRTYEQQYVVAQPLPQRRY